MIYLPYPDFQSSARCLDSELLGKMRWKVRSKLEFLIFEAPIGYSIRWSGAEFALCSFGFELCNEWILRGNVDTIRASLMDLSQLIKCSLPPEPDWLFDETRLKKERIELWNRDSNWYGRFWNSEGKLNA